MRTFELRVYKLRTKEALDFYMDKRYMQSAEFADDIRTFNVSDIVGVESTILIPSTGSPLK
jgi:hypothetical protein